MHRFISIRDAPINTSGGDILNKDDPKFYNALYLVFRKKMPKIAAAKASGISYTTFRQKYNRLRLREDLHRRLRIRMRPEP
jgi:hypothetical protein